MQEVVAAAERKKNTFALAFLSLAFNAIQWRMP